MDTITAFSIIALAALIHTSFQLSVSMITLLSGHAIGKKMASRRVTHLVMSFLTGTIVMTLLIVSFISFLSVSLLRHGISPIAWSVLAGAMIGAGLVVWVFYYRRGKGTTLWIPRSFAHFLQDRIEATKNGAEAFSLGLTGVFAEIFFIATPATAAAFTLVHLPTNYQVAGVALYTLIASLGTIIVTVLVGGGHRISDIQRWRAHNRRFLQFVAGSSLIVLGFYLYVNEVVTPVALLAGGR